MRPFCHISPLPKSLGTVPQANYKAPNRAQMPPKCPHFRELMTITSLQPEASLSANSAKMPMS